MAYLRQRGLGQAQMIDWNAVCSPSAVGPLSPDEAGICKIVRQNESLVAGVDYRDQLLDQSEQPSWVFPALLGIGAIALWGMFK